MVLWEITLATAYFLGLKRTYRLALRIQKRVIGPKHPKIRRFVYGKVRSVFDVAVSFHLKIQQRDIEVGRNLGNRILRWLDRMKPTAEIRGHHEKPSSKIINNNSNVNKHLSNSAQQLQSPKMKLSDRDSKGKLLFSTLGASARSFPTVAMMMQPIRPAGMNGQYRQISHFAPAAVDYRLGSRSNGGVFRSDIALLMQQQN